MASLGKIIVMAGVLLVVLGLILMVGENIPFIGKLPGDIHVQKKNFSFHFPITTCIILSLLLTLIFSLLRRR
jgi:hypothetical protein